MNKPVSKLDIAKSAAFTALEKYHRELVTSLEIKQEATGSNQGSRNDRAAGEDKVARSRQETLDAVRNWADATVAAKK